MFSTIGVTHLLILLWDSVIKILHTEVHASSSEPRLLPKSLAFC